MLELSHNAVWKLGNISFFYRPSTYRGPRYCLCFSRALLTSSSCSISTKACPEGLPSLSIVRWIPFAPSRIRHSESTGMLVSIDLKRTCHCAPQYHVSHPRRTAEGPERCTTTGCLSPARCTPPPWPLVLSPVDRPAVGGNLHMIHLPGRHRVKFWLDLLFSDMRRKLPPRSNPSLSTDQQLLNSFSREHPNPAAVE